MCCRPTLVLHYFLVYLLWSRFVRRLLYSTNRRSAFWKTRLECLLVFLLRWPGTSSCSGSGYARTFPVSKDQLCTSLNLKTNTESCSNVTPMPSSLAGAIQIYRYNNVMFRKIANTNDSYLQIRPSIAEGIFWRPLSVSLDPVELNSVGLTVLEPFPTSVCGWFVRPIIITVSYTFWWTLPTSSLIVPALGPL